MRHKRKINTSNGIVKNDLEIPVGIFEFSPLLTDWLETDKYGNVFVYNKFSQYKQKKRERNSY